MRLNDINFIRLLPKFMQDDPFNIAISKGIDEVVKIFVSYVPSLSIWSALDKLSEEELDDLAWELNIPWYEYQSSPDIKREVIKNSGAIQRKLGTKWAVEEIIDIYFGDGNISEWFDYEGAPGHFRVFSSNPAITEEELNKFLRIISHVKRKSAVLDSIIISLAGSMNLYTGAGAHITDTWTIQIKNK